MSTDPGVRRLLPQSSQMQSFSFAPNNFGARENQKSAQSLMLPAWPTVLNGAPADTGVDYVFVDEHNRHKRLKVMRACEGCRRRKIKCDAATTNTWPCSACVRLKLHCIPPTVNYNERDLGRSGQGFDDVGDYEDNGVDDGFQMSMEQHMSAPQRPQQQNMYSQPNLYDNNIAGYHQMGYARPQSQQTLQYNQLQASAPIIDHQYAASNVYPMATMPQQLQQQTQNQQSQQLQHQQQPQQIQLQRSESPDPLYQEAFQQQDLADLLGDLKIDASGNAPYLNSKLKSVMTEEPAFEDLEDYKHPLPVVTSGPDLKVRIPPELMLDEETALNYFDLYFSNVHPYVPVLSKTLFYQQWHTQRDAISPLVLEAIFAIAGRLADEPSQGQQWLALASKHADSFMDVPRLSTLQALLIVLKARESAPKRGYYYRSWMTVVQCVAMAKDLGLDDHYQDHQEGKSCGSTLTECSTKTRIWQTLFVCELMIGSPQGRTDLAVDIETLDLSIPRPIPGDEAEYQVARNFTFFTRVVCNVRRQNQVYAKLKRKTDWGSDPALAQLNPLSTSWFRELPPDLQITFPQDTSSPWIPSHFLGNLHSYYYLSIIMLHRQQLSALDPTDINGLWKHHMVITYNAAKQLCRVQEAILEYYGMTGLLCMQRGINFTIYCILTCVLLHIVALTSPDPEINTDARDFFSRHMRILEKCTSSWPMPDMQQQIDALREAFSADTRKPFTLRPNFPHGSPKSSNHVSPAASSQYNNQVLRSPLDHPGLSQEGSFSSHYGNPITPPISASSVHSENLNKTDSPAMQIPNTSMIGAQQRVNMSQSIPSAMPMIDTPVWNPSRIFDQWNTTFGAAAVHGTNMPPPNPLRVEAGVQEGSTLPELSGGGILPITAAQHAASNHFSQTAPSLWLETVQRTYEAGLKRQWDYDEHNLNQSSSSKRVQR